MAQIAPPITDIATGHWSPTPLWKRINARTVNLSDPTYVGTSVVPLPEIHAALAA